MQPVLSSQTWMSSVSSLASGLTIYWGIVACPLNSLAAALGAMLAYTLFRHSYPAPWVVFLFLFISTLSHALLDMLTNGGQGVALWASFSNARHFFLWRPIEASPIGVRRFFSRRGVQIMRSELRQVWLPSAGIVILGMMVRWWLPGTPPQ
jgi:inner membrane protein